MNSLPEDWRGRLRAYQQVQRPKALYWPQSTTLSTVVCIDLDWPGEQPFAPSRKTSASSSLPTARRATVDERHHGKHFPFPSADNFGSSRREAATTEI